MSSKNYRDLSQDIESFKDDLKSALQTVGKENTGKLLGINLDNKKDFTKKVDEFVTEFQKSSKEYSHELRKARKLKDLNKSLTQNFKQNLEVMVDVTHLLTSYINLFDTIKLELQKMNKMIGDTTDINDITHLESITHKHIYNLQNQFNIQTEKLQQIYKENNMTNEHLHITNTREQMKHIITNATKIWESKDEKLEGGCNKRQKKSTKFFK